MQRTGSRHRGSREESKQEAGLAVHATEKGPSPAAFTAPMSI
ncbi:unnamed protein product [Gulo gulo]|uniref:Uncharacterized protein n=1 Tax=Gulo gulo TaxID=48420 RepID=A0A9X9M459_GULGU|nr:unnamed protein product [Gulo gulo]